MVDRVVLDRHRAVATTIFDLELVGQRDLLAGLDAIPDRLAILQPDPAALVEREFGIDQVAVVLEQPLDAEAIAVEDFLVGLERDDDVAIGLVALVPVANEIGDKGSRHIFVVRAAARIEVAVVLGELERFDRPVVADSRNDIEMRNQEDRLARPAAV